MSTENEIEEYVPETDENTPEEEKTPTLKSQVGKDAKIMEALKTISKSRQIKTYVRTEGDPEKPTDVYAAGYKTILDGSDGSGVPQVIYVFVSHRNQTHHVPHKRVEEIINPGRAAAVAAVGPKQVDKLDALIARLEAREAALAAREAKVADAESKLTKKPS